MNRVQVWVYASRPKTLVIGISPVVMGATLAISQGIFNPMLFLFTLFTTLAIQIGITVDRVANQDIRAGNGLSTEGAELTERKIAVHRISDNSFFQPCVDKMRSGC